LRGPGVVVFCLRSFGCGGAICCVSLQRFGLPWAHSIPHLPCKAHSLQSHVSLWRGGVRRN
jgi:hypothetical protein